jgi:tRNA wybutosine-synthesizing protein 3
LTKPEEEYSDNSPKGTVDVQILDLIREINAYDGLVTTSSCAGRVAVFVEGPTVTKEPAAAAEQSPDASGDDVEDDDRPRKLARPTTTASPGGKGGGRWLYVSHDPIPIPSAEGLKRTTTGVLAGGGGQKSDYFTETFNLTPMTERPTFQNAAPAKVTPRLIHLSFSPLILHVHCATLQDARPVLSAAVNAGFRESGVSSLRVMDNPDHGVMVAVRTAGLSFETTIGVVDSTERTRQGGGDDNEERDRPLEQIVGQKEQEKQPEIMRSIVSEDYLAMCAGVVNERFRWNAERRERFRAELHRAMEAQGLGPGQSSSPHRMKGDGSLANNGWEDKDDRRRRKRQEGLDRQKREKASTDSDEKASDDDIDGGLSMLGID